MQRYANIGSVIARCCVIEFQEWKILPRNYDRADDFKGIVE